MHEPAPTLRVGGTLGLDDLYIRRAEDEVALSTLLDGEFCNILTSRQMGKSSLMIRLIARLAEKGIRTASVDMAGDLGAPADYATWYTGFVEKITLDLGLDCEIDAFWKQAKGTPNQRLLQFFREVLGAQIQERVVLFVDEVDSSLRLPYSDDFFTAIRTIYNQRSMVEAFGRLTFCMLGTASPIELIKDRRTTPYNIGRTLELRDFDFKKDDLGDLYKSMNEGGSDGEQRVRGILEWTGGHPFLTLALCRLAKETGARDAAAVNGMMADVLSNQADTVLRTHFEWINNFLKTRLHEQGPAFRLYGSVLNGKRVKDGHTLTHIEMKLSGLVKRDPDGHLIVRNQLYAQRFGSEWLNQQRPIIAQRWAIRGALALGVVAALAMTIAVYTTWHAGEALFEEDRKRAEDLLGKLADAAGEAEAAQYERDLCAIASKYPTRSSPAVMSSQIRTARDAFWDKLADRLDAEGQAALKGGDLERALLLGALAAVKRGTVSPWLKTAYQESYVPSLSLTLRGHELAVEHIRFLDQDRLVSAGTDNTLRLWDVQAGIEIRRLAIPALSAMGVCGGARCVASASSSMAAGQIWTPDLLQSTDFKLPHDKRVYTIAGIPGSEGTMFVATSSEDGYARYGKIAPSTTRETSLLDLRSFPRMPPSKVAPVYAVQMSGDGRELVTAAMDGVHVWEVASSGSPVTLPYPESAFDARFSQDGTQVVAAMETQALVWSLSNRRLMGHITGFGPFLTSAFSPKDEDWVVSAVRDGKQGLVLVWRVSTQGRILERRMTVPIRNAEFRPDGKEVAAALEDGTIRFFWVGPEPIVTDARERWSSWQRKLGLTLDEEWKKQPLPPEGARQATIRSQAVCGQSLSVSPQ